MPKKTRKKVVKAVRSVRTSKAVRRVDNNRLIIAALVLLLAVAVYMLVETWTGI